MEADMYCFRRWDRYGAVGEVGQNSIVLASFTLPTVLLAVCVKKSGC